MLSEQSCVVTGASVLASKPFECESSWTLSDALKRRKLFTRPSVEVPLLPFWPAQSVVDRFVSRPDSRYMGPQFQFGVACAGLVLEQAHVASDEERSTTGLCIATRVAERDEAIDEALLSTDGATEDVAERLMRTFRPNMFLAQLPNLLASNLSIAFGLRGTSRTYIGDQMAGANALYQAVSNVQRGHSKRVLAGGSLNANRENLLRWIHGARIADTGQSRKSVWDESRTGCILGSSAAFLMLEDEEESKYRSVAALARITCYGRVRGQLSAPSTQELVLTANEDLAKRTDASPLVISNAYGGPSSRDELVFWRQHFPESAIMSSADIFGTTLEADAPSQVVLAIQALGKPTEAFPAYSAQGKVRVTSIRSVLVVTTGFFGDVAVFGVEALQ